MLIAGAAVLGASPQRGSYATPSSAPSLPLRPSAMRLPPDVPTVVVFLHLAALAALLLRVAAARFRRAAVFRQSRNLPSPAWLLVLHALLGLPRT